jgi:hypothetical protein
METVKLLKPKVTGEDWVRIDIDNTSSKMKRSTQYITFHCQYTNSMYLETRFENTTTPPKAEQVFNLNFMKELTRQYCTVSRGGRPVPKADFAMNNQQDNTSSRIA